MAYEFLRKLFKKDENGAVIPMTYEELEAAIDADKGIKIADLSGGGYVAKDKFDAKETELKGIRKQLDDANTQIKSFEDQDVDGIKQKVADWEAKYNTDTQALKDQMAAQNRSHAEDMFLAGYNFTSKAARKGVLDELRSKQFQLDDKGTFLGAKEFMSSLMEDEDYKGAFVTENPAGDTNQGNGGTNPPEGTKPRFSTGTNGGNPQGGDANPFLHMGFTHLREPKKD
ncbi:phage scaffolding protein [Fusicatenibacter saccharivorans]|uniref:Phage minor structural protein GP20 n=1 Tax=Fusicatenibacter saccharivorans TaxID=1150298 RepID=A0A174K280_9FIRM|nr:phage scaffolding protein [Fusicatenibacter saccharivorans]CUP03545.1 Phage minor structural protein GP20 [Fusicatenibacter saccharivorans]